jgi:glutathione S-transferase
MKRLDDGIHLATFTVSFGIAFHYWFLERTPAERKAYLDGLHDPARRERMAELIEQGMESPAFHAALLRFAALMEEFDRALSEGPWLVGETFSLAERRLCTLSRAPCSSWSR